MTTRAQKLRLGLFMLVALLLLLGSIVTLAGLKLWNPRDRYILLFRDSVSGLESGSTVRMKGVRVGTVEKITIDNVERVKVVLALVPGTPVKVDTHAVMSSLGITGLQFIELTGGSSRAAALPPNTDKSIIVTDASAIQTLTGQAQDIALKMEKALNNLLRLTDEGNQTRVRTLLDSADKLAQAWTEVARASLPRVQRILAHVDRTTSAIDKSAQAVAQLVTAATPLVRSTLASTDAAARSARTALAGVDPKPALAELTRASKALRQKAEDPALTRALSSLGQAASRISSLVTELSRMVTRRDRQIGTVLSTLDQAASNLRGFTSAIRDRPSLLLRGETRKEKPIP